MSSHTVSSLPRISNSELSTLLLAHSTSNLDAPRAPSHIAIIDVRDDGGHIKHSLHIPSHTHDHQIPSLVRKMADKEIVIFHCALSQVRGPKAALKYVRERERLIPGSTTKSGTVGETLKTSAKGEEGKGDADAERDKEGEGEWEDVDGEGEGRKEQKVYVLKGGFVEWQEKFGEDSRLTEGYERSIWKEGYWM